MYNAQDTKWFTSPGILVSKVWEGWLICDPDTLASLRIITNMRVIDSMTFTINEDVNEYQIEVEQKYMEHLDSWWGNAIWGLTVKDAT